MSVQLEMFPTPAVTLRMSFEGILGLKPQWMPEAERRRRWATWLRLARAKKKTRDVAEYWRDKSECWDCIHLRGSWCTAVGLPNTVNPYLTMRHGMIGMACAGAGHKRRPELPPIESEAVSALPF